MQNRGNDGWGQPEQPQYGQPQYTQPYYQAPAPKKSHRGLKITGGIVGGIVLIGIIGAALGGGGKNGSTSTAASAPTTPAARSAKGATHAATSQAPQGPAKTVVYSGQGSGEKTTPTFRVNSTDYSVAYTYNCASFGTSGNFAIEVQSSGDQLFDDSAANTIGMKGADTSYFHDGPGTLYLSILSECSWTVKVTDGDNG